MDFMDFQKTLEENGFSKAESRVYLELLQLGESKAGQIIKKTTLQSSVVYNALNTLINKGFINYIIKGKIKHYRALKPKLIEEHIKRKQHHFQSILPELELIKSKNKDDKIEVEIFEGYKGLLSATLDLINSNYKKKQYKYFASSQLTSEAQTFFEKVDMIKKEKNLEVRGIANQESYNILKNYKNSKIKYTNQTIPPAMNIFKNHIILFSFTAKPIAILIKSKEMARQYNKMWDEIWTSSK